MSLRSNKNRGFGSIARSINFEFWIREFMHLLLLDIVLAGAVVFTYFMWCEAQIPSRMIAVGRDFIQMDSLETATYVITMTNGEDLEFGLYIPLILCKIPVAALLTVELMYLFANLFSVGTVRKKMMPLNEIAIRTDELTRNTGSSAVNLKTMENAISQLNPEMPDARVVTGDKELQSLEIAINNLLARMRESHRQQERFVSDASHELRTPIAVIQGYVNMLDRWGKDDEQILKESIEALKNESEHMKNLVEQLLFLARGDSGRNTLNFEEFDLAEVVHDVMEESEMIDENHVYRFENSSGDKIMVNCDLAMLKQSMRIFVQNAAKYSNQGDTITLKAGFDKRPFYCVQDEGVGMESEEVVHVFERFYRSDQARNSVKGGTGLGLSIAKWIVDAHGGEIEILTRPGLGTRIKVLL